MDKSNMLKLLKHAESGPELEYNDNILKFRDNVYCTLRAVRRRLGALEELIGEIEFEITLNHLEDEEY